MTNQQPQLIGSDGELLTPRELDPSELLEIEQYAEALDEANDGAEVADPVENAEARQIWPQINWFRLARRVLYLSIILVLTDVFFRNGLQLGASFLVALAVIVIPRAVINMVAIEFATLFPRPARRIRRAFRRLMKRLSDFSRS